MDAAANAAAEAGTATLTFALVVAGIVIFILGSLVWWFFRDRLQQTHARLNAGNQKFEKQDQELEAVKTSLQANVQAIHGAYVHRDDCKEHRGDFKVLLSKQDKKLDRMVDTQSCFDGKLTALQAEVSTGFKTITGLVAQVVELGSKEDA